MSPGILKLAQVLEEMFNLRFNRRWEDLPEDCQQDFIEAAQELVKRMNENGIS